MGTSKLLQTPSVLSLEGSTFRIAHPDISNYTRTEVTSPLTAAGTTLTVADNNHFEDNDWFILGEVGHNKTEECDVNGAVTRGTSITITNSTKFSHEIHSPATRIYERGVKIYGAATDGGAGTLIASIDAVTTPIADAVMIQWNREYTEFTMITTDTTYAYYYAKFTDGVTDSSASEYIPSTGVAYNTAYALAEEGLLSCNAEIDGDLITEEWLLSVMNDWQDDVTHYTFQDGQTKDWTFEIEEETTSITATTNENKYALSGLTADMKYPYSHQGIIQAKFGSDIIEYVDLEAIEDEYDGVARTTVATAATAGATSVVLADTYEFAENGTAYVGTDTITYTANAESTATLSGVPASGTGAFTTTQAVGSVAWQGITPGLPEKYTIFDGNIIFDVPTSSDYAGYKVKFKYFKKLDRLTSLSEIVAVTIYHLAKLYVAYRVEERKGNLDNAERFKAKYDTALAKEAIRELTQVTEQSGYYDWSV